jgi:3-hydroxyacyl-CoA dehydrogenase/enoyl-CoA hydratase/3-hydroxybutyryl-CoA epimerase
LVRGEEAKKMGLVDEIHAGEELLEMAVSKHIRDRKEEATPGHPIKCAVMPDSGARKPIFQEARESVLAGTREHHEAALRILDLLESSLDNPRPVYLEKEAQLLGELAVSEQSRKLQHLYFLRATSRKYADPADDKEGGTG